MLRLALSRSNLREYWCVIWLILCMFLFPVCSSDASESPDVLLQGLAFKALRQHLPHSGALYKASLPANLSGMEISVIRLRSKTLWRKGTNFGYIHIPPKTLPVPHVRRIFIVYQDFGNLSSHYYNVTGYSLVSSVVGFMAYDASNLSSNSVIKLSLKTVGKPIEIRFPDLTFPVDSIERRKCVAFGANSAVYRSEVRAATVCDCTQEGYFSIVVPLKRKRRVWDLWVRGFVLGFVGLFLVCSAGMVLAKFAMAKKIHEMEREADDAVALETIWLGTSKMPSAAVTRTHPVLESASLS